MRRGKSTLLACSPCSLGAQLTLFNSSIPQVVASGIWDSPEGPGRKGMRLWSAYPLLAGHLPPPGRSDTAITSHNVGKKAEMGMQHHLLLLIIVVIKVHLQP